MSYFNKALELDPHQGRYYYGRARALLLAGRGAEAAADFQKAADLGSRDAIDYLQP
jgi:Flp pilus assembly protein TadD